MIDEKNDSNDYKNIINKTYEISSAFENISNSALINSASALANTLENLSSAIPSEGIKGIMDIREAAAASVIGLSNAFVIDSRLIESTQVLAKTMVNISDSLMSENLRRTGELAATQSIQEIANTVQKMTVSIPSFSEMVSEIDWDTVDFTDSDIEEAEEIISSKSIDVAVSEEINKDTAVPQLPNSIVFIVFLFVLILNNFCTFRFFIN